MPRLKRKTNELSQILYGAKGEGQYSMTDLARYAGRAVSSVKAVMTEPEKHFDKALRMLSGMQVPLERVRAAIHYDY